MLENTTNNLEAPHEKEKPLTDEKEKPFSDEEIKAIMNRKTYIEMHSKDNEGKLIGTMQINVKVIKYRWIWGYNRFQVTPLSGKGTVWKHWKQLKAFTTDQETKIG